MSFRYCSHVAKGKTYPPEQQNSMAVKDKRCQKNTEKVPNVSSETVEKKVLHEFLLLLLFLFFMRKTYPPEQQNSMAVKDKMGPKKY